VVPPDTVSNKISQVAGPTCPSAVKPFLFWNEIIAL